MTKCNRANPSFLIQLPNVLNVHVKQFVLVQTTRKHLGRKLAYTSERRVVVQ